MSLALKESIRTARLNLVLAAIDAAATPGKLWLYTGTRPAAEAVTSEALQSTIVLADPCGAVAAAVFTLTPDVEALRIDNQEIRWGRFTDGDDNFVADVNVRITGYVATGLGDEPDIQIDNPNGYIGGFVRLEAGTIGE